jgi:hypothetical protein
MFISIMLFDFLKKLRKQKNSAENKDLSRF